MFASSTLLDGKVSIVTGAGRGIGRSSAMALAAVGSKVVVADTDEVAGAETIELIGAEDSALFVATDVSDPVSVQRLVDVTMSEFGRLDIALNNAGIDHVGPAIADTDLDDWQRVLSVNLTGVWLCMRAQIPAMLASGGGSIINTSSNLGVVASPKMAAYVASKHGVIGLTKAAALEYSAMGIRVNALCPGVVRTDMFAAISATDPGLIEWAIAQHPIGRVGEVEEIAQAVVWLASDASSFVTGATIPVDGGYTAH